MTETLAKLYTEQRLYTKAIKAYEILQNKHPEKAEDFKAKIQEIKDLKKKTKNCPRILEFFFELITIRFIKFLQISDFLLIYSRFFFLK